MIWVLAIKKINSLLLTAPESRRVFQRKLRCAFPITMPVDVRGILQIFTRMIFYTKRTTIPPNREIVVLRPIWAGLC